MGLVEKALKHWQPLVIYILFAVGTVCHIIPATRDLMLDMTPFFLLLSGLFVLHPTFLDRNYRILAWALLTYIATFSVEALGVETGLIFGEYDYGGTLGLKLLDVPLVIGFNWVMVVMASVMLAQRLVKKKIPAVILGGLLAMFFDVLLEPVAMELDYWNWDGGTVPLQNYAAWFIIAAVASAFYLRSDRHTDDPLPIHYLIAQFVFFFLLGLFVVGWWT